MSLSWRQRKIRLSVLVSSNGDENADGTAVDRLMHGQSVIGKTSKTSEIDGLRFQDKDLQVAGTLEYGQFGVIDVVTCRLDNRVYARKSIEKSFALRTREQCSPQTERDILLQATLTNSPWAPHLLAAYQMPTHLHLVMEYAEGGTLWDVLESSPLDGRILEADLRWWAPQAVSAIHWCHTQGFAHRDIKPHNFVLTRESHVLLIDFGSAAPLLPPGPDGSQRLHRQHCLVPCGTCDYISPEILKAHEEALVALEMDEEDDVPEVTQETEGYGLETDWWSLGAMLYEMVYGAAPFFANEIRHTYQRIMNHEKSLRFPDTVDVSAELHSLLQGLLRNAESRLGRRNILEIIEHSFFDDVDWTSLSTEPPPSSIHLPQFTYNEPQKEQPPPSNGLAQSQSEAYSQGFAFSALFQSSRATSPGGVSFLRSSGTPANVRSPVRDDPSSSFIGFSWGPTIDAFPDQSPGSEPTPLPTVHTRTPAPLRTLSVVGTPAYSWPASNNRYLTPGYAQTLTTPRPNPLHYMTPVRAFSYSPMHTIQRTSTIRRTAPRRTVSDRDAMKELVNCIGMSARKKVLESGRKPKILTSFSMRISREMSSDRISEARTKPKSGTATATNSNGGTLRKELRFFPTPTAIPVSDTSMRSDGVSGSTSFPKSRLAPLVLEPVSPGRAYPHSASETESEGPPSPSPTPRPGSAMSRRSGTPTLTATSASATFSQRIRSMSGSSSNGMLGPWSAASTVSRVGNVSTGSASGTASAVLGPLKRKTHGRTMSGSSLRRVSTSFGEESRRDASLEEESEGEEERAEERRSSDEGGEEEAAVTLEQQEQGQEEIRYEHQEEGWHQRDDAHDEHQGQEYDDRPEDEDAEEEQDPWPTRRAWDDLEYRHSRMMLDIRQLEDRLEQISRSVAERPGNPAGRRGGYR